MVDRVVRNLEIPVMYPEFGFSGTQSPLTRPQQLSLGNVLGEIYARGGRIMHHGDCIGADAFAHMVWMMLEGYTHIHPPTDESKRAFCRGAERLYAPQSYLERNMQIAARGGFLVACPKGVTEERRSGTWATIRYFRQQNKHIILIYSTGEVMEEPRV